MPNIFQNDKREVIAQLPISGQEVKLRPPTGRDMKAIERQASEETTTTGVVMQSIAVLSGMELSAIEDLDAEDVEVLSNALMLFPIFSKYKK